MNISSWFHRSLSKNTKEKKNPLQQQQSQSSRFDQNQEKEAELLGITQSLTDYVKSFTLETFKNFPLQDYEADNSNAQNQISTNVRQDLSDWQERHAVLILSKVKELSQLRFKLCPRYLKEDKFWSIYFMLVKSHVAEYELQAIRLAKLKRIAIENENASNTGSYEVEMAERNQTVSVAQSTP